MTVWQPGMRCVCIRQWPAGLPDANLPILGVVYTVRKVDKCGQGDKLLLWLSELDNTHLVGRSVFIGGQFGYLGNEPGFDADDFRPLSENRLDSLRALLNPMPARKKERVS